MRILLLTHSFAPELTPRAFRWTAIARSLVVLGHQVDVICACPPGSPGRESMGGVELHRVRYPFSRAPLVSNAGCGPKPRTGSFKALVHRALRNIWRRLYWPDYACGWYLPAVRLASKAIAGHHYDWMISVSHPFTAHMVGFTLKRRFPKLRWLADVGDPFSLMEDPAPNNLRWYRRANLVADRAVFRNADVVTVTTEGTRDLYAGVFVEGKGKVVVVPPLLTLPPGSSRTPSREGGRSIRLIYSGTLYRSLRSPIPLLVLFEQLVALLSELHLELHFYGAMNDCADIVQPYQKRLPNRIFIHGMVSREHIRKAMQEADVLVNLGNRSIAQIPSKVIEYGAMCRPILNLVTVENDSSVGVLNGYPAVLTLHLSDHVVTADQTKQVASFVRSRPSVKDDEVGRWLARFTVDRVLEDYLLLLRDPPLPT